MELKSYTLEELQSHVGPMLTSTGHAVPLSSLRMASYLANPRAENSDPVLFELHYENRLVAYRTVLPDLYYDKRGNPQRFAWLSGNFVDPEFRRKGLSTRLLQSVEAHWEGRLMYTNYAPASKALYDGTGQFPMLTSKPGKRYYLRSAANELLGGRMGKTDLLRTGDFLVNKLREGQLKKFPPLDSSLCHIERMESLDSHLIRLIEKVQQKSLFRRDETVFSWILKKPWVTDQPQPELNYHFTYRARRFENIILKFTLPGNGRYGLLWLVLHNQKVTVPYAMVENHEIYPFMTSTLIHTMIDHGSAYSTIRHPDLMRHLLKHRKLFLSTRKMPQLLFAHKKIAATVPKELWIHDGDGDVVFTG